MRDEELVGAEPLARLLECARAAVGATSARLERCVVPASSLPVVRLADGSVRVTSPEGGGRHPMLVLGGCSPGRFTATQSEVLLLCGSLIGSVVRATERSTERAKREARRDAVHAVAMAAVQHLDLDAMLLDAVEALRLGIRSQGVWIRAFDSPDPASLRRHSASYPHWAGALATEELLDVSGRAARICWERQCASMMSLDEPGTAPLTDEAERDFMFDFMRSIQARGLLMAPLGGAGKCQGFIALTRTTVDEPFDAEDETAVMTIGRELGNAVVHSRLFARQGVLVEELQELHDYKDSFVATVAHQLKSPLTSIIGHIELLEEAPDQAGQAGPEMTLTSLPVIARGAERIRETVDALLTLSKVQLAHRPLIPGCVPLAKLVSECADLLGADALERGVTIDLRGLTTGSTAWGDQAELEKVVDNLLSNAVKYSRPGGTVLVATYDDGDGVVLECRDSGLGIGVVDLERLFEPFHRSTSPEALAEPGTGLGMAIVKAVVDRHLGHIDVDSEPGVGTMLRVWLPAPPR
jgi:signal transduction histidine kinase